MQTAAQCFVDTVVPVVPVVPVVFPVLYSRCRIPGVDVDDGFDSDAEETFPACSVMQATGSDQLRVTPTGVPAEPSDALGSGHGHGLSITGTDPDPATAFPHTGLPYNPSDFAHHMTRRARGLPFW